MKVSDACSCVGIHPYAEIFELVYRLEDLKFPSFAFLWPTLNLRL